MPKFRIIKGGGGEPSVEIDRSQLGGHHEKTVVELKNRFGEAVYIQLSDHLKQHLSGSNSEFADPEAIGDVANGIIRLIVEHHNIEKLKLSPSWHIIPRRTRTFILKEFFQKVHDHIRIT